MKKLLLALMFTSSANALVEFNTGDIVTAADINGNFQELEDNDLTNEMAIVEHEVMRLADLSSELERRMSVLEGWHVLPPPPAAFNIFTDGVLLGTAVELPIGGDTEVSVTLHGYQDQTILLDVASGVFTGFEDRTVNGSVYFEARGDCSGDTYVSYIGKGVYEGDPVSSEPEYFANTLGFFLAQGPYIQAMDGMGSKTGYGNFQCLDITASESTRQKTFRRAFPVDRPAAYTPPTVRLPITVEHIE